MLICALYYGDILFVVWERQKQTAKPFWNLLELETLLERVVLVSDWLHSDGWYLLIEPFKPAGRVFSQHLLVWTSR